MRILPGRQSGWWKHGSLNLLEHGLTRGADAASTLLLLWALPSETFSKLALAQAWVAPLLLVFVSPEAVLYRDFKAWGELGPRELSSRLHALRLFGWGKAQLALVLAFGMALSGIWWGTGSFWGRFCALVWAFSLALAPQISGPDREYLRLDLELKSLNAITLAQKLSLFFGTAAVAWIWPGRLEPLAGVAVISASCSAVLAYRRVSGVFRARGWAREFSEGKRQAEFIGTLSDALRSFSIWQHLSGVVLNWVQTLDVFFLGLYRFPAREVGLYAAALKLANFALVLPLALSNVISLWLGRGGNAERHREWERMTRLTGLLLGGACAQAGILLALSPWIFSWLSHGRWSDAERSQMTHWLLWMLAGSAPLSASFVISSWLTLRASVQELFLRISLPWMILSLVLYAGFIARFGLEGAAWANPLIAGVYLSLLARMALQFRRFSA